MYFLYKCRVCQAVFTSDNFPDLSQAQAAHRLRMMLSQGLTHAFTEEPPTFQEAHEGGARCKDPSDITFYRELICEHPDGCGVADLIGTTSVPLGNSKHFKWKTLPLMHIQSTYFVETGPQPAEPGQDDPVQVDPAKPADPAKFKSRL